jgi:hypothetical protein
MVDQSASRQDTPAESGASGPAAEGLLDDLGLASACDCPLPEVYGAALEGPAYLTGVMELMRSKTVQGTALTGGRSFAPMGAALPRRTASPPALATRPAQPQASSTLIAWIGDRRSRLGDELKKVLKAAALEQFPDTKARAFDAAYKAVYSRKKGRPHKPAR